MLEKPVFQVGTVLVSNNTENFDARVIVIGITSKGVPIVVNYNQWHPFMTWENCMAPYKTMHWAPAAAMNTPFFTWKMSNPEISHQLIPCGWSVYGCHTAVCPNQELPPAEVYNLNSNLIRPPTPDKIIYPIGTRLMSNFGRTGWIVVGHTAKQSPRVVREAIGHWQPPYQPKPLHWTKQGWRVIHPVSNRPEYVFPIPEVED